MTTIPTFYLGDLATGDIVEELPLATMQWSRQLNSAGGWSATISTHHPIVTRDLFMLGRSTVWVDIGGLLEFGGIVWNLKLDTESGVLGIGGEGIYSYFSHRCVSADLTYTGKDLFFIVDALLVAAQPDPVLSDIGLVATFPLGATSGVNRTITYPKIEHKKFAEAIEELSSADDGFEYFPHYAWSGSTPTTVLQCHHRRRGRHLGLSWELGRHYAIDGDYELSGVDLANRIFAIGSAANDESAVGTVTGKRLDAVTDHKSTTDATQLAAEARHDLARQSVPAEAFKLRSLVPDPLPAEWSVGDEVYVVGELAPGWMLDDSYRIVGYEAAADEQGAVKVGVEVAAGAPLGKPLPTVAQYAARQRAALLRRVQYLERA